MEVVPELGYPGAHLDVARRNGRARRFRGKTLEQTTITIGCLVQSVRELKTPFVPYRDGAPFECWVELNASQFPFR